MDSNLLLESLLRVMRELRSQYDASAQDIGLTLARARVISVLGRMEGASQAGLAAALMIKPPTLKRQLDALERDGFIERRAQNGDVRKRALYLTERSRAVTTTRFIEKVRADLMRDISTEEQQVVRQVLDRIADNATALARK
ncbi:MAG TPA: MarR family transcriptional regulator [Paenirhodobacter sp.]